MRARVFFLFCAATATGLAQMPEAEQPTRPLGGLRRAVAAGSTQLVLRAEDPDAFAFSLDAGIWLAIGSPPEEIPLLRVAASPGVVQLELLWSTARAHPELTAVAMLMVPREPGCEDPPKPLKLEELPAPEGIWPRWLAALDFAAASLTHPLIIFYKPRTGEFRLSALPPVASRCDGPSAPLAAGWLPPFRRLVPLPNDQLLAFSPRDGLFEVFGCEGQWSELARRALPGKTVGALAYNATMGRPAMSTLPCTRRTHGTWDELRGHELAWLSGRLLAYQPATAKFSLWAWDTDVSGRADPIRLSEGPLSSGSWLRKFGAAAAAGGGAAEGQAHLLTLLDQQGLLMQRTPEAGSYALWSAARLSSHDVGTHPMGGGESSCARGPCFPTAMEQAMERPGEAAAAAGAPPASSLADRLLMSEPSARPPPKGSLLSRLSPAVPWPAALTHQVEVVPAGARWPPALLGRAAAADLRRGAGAAEAARARGVSELLQPRGGDDWWRAPPPAAEAAAAAAAARSAEEPPRGAAPTTLVAQQARRAAGSLTHPSMAGAGGASAGGAGELAAPRAAALLELEMGVEMQSPAQVRVVVTEPGPVASEPPEAAPAGAGTRRANASDWAEAEAQAAGDVRLVEWDASGGSALFRVLRCSYSAAGAACDVVHGGHALRPSWPCDARTSAAGCAQEGAYCAWCAAIARCVPSEPAINGSTPCLDGYIEGQC